MNNYDSYRPLSRREAEFMASDFLHSHYTRYAEDDPIFFVPNEYKQDGGTIDCELWFLDKHLYLSDYGMLTLVSNNTRYRDNYGDKIIKTGVYILPGDWLYKAITLYRQSETRSKAVDLLAHAICVACGIEQPNGYDWRPQNAK